MKILIVPVLAGKPWHGDTVLSEPLGGSEAAVAYLAQAFARHEHDVTVVTSHPENPMKDLFGVQYLPAVQGVYEHLATTETYDAVISSRWPGVLGLQWQAPIRALWLHDVAPQQPIKVNANRLVFLSRFQASTYGVGEERIGDGVHFLIGDGVDANLVANIPTVEKRDDNKLIWASNPDRGLALAAYIMREVRKRWPDMKLHVFGRASVYGWDTNVEWPNMPRSEDMENIVLHEPLPRAGLLAEMASAFCTFYPTFWPETYCMATLESQAVGTPVISSPVGALPETVKGGILTHDLLNAISQLRNQRRWQKLSVTGIEWARLNTWDILATRWEEEVLSGE